MTSTKRPNVRVLFICVHNAARSQMAEALAGKMGEGRIHAQSAGFEPTSVNPLAVEAMARMGIDISEKTTRSVFDLFKQGKLFDYVITVCDESTAEQCPVFPGIVKRLHWSFSDPSTFGGSQEEKILKTIAVRDQIQQAIRDWIKTL